MRAFSTLPAAAALLTLLGFILSVNALRSDVNRAASTMWITAVSIFLTPLITGLQASQQERGRPTRMSRRLVDEEASSREEQSGE